ncbi:MAG: rhomboid family intramembrane serine protease [Gemmatimonadetes bacterium]|nr:rhomboid family intramembrane serine protease [Gemmatimonadota bacterium]
MPAILCPKCHKLISSAEARCPFCGQVRPGMWGFTSWFRKLGLSIDFPSLITTVCVILYIVGLAMDPGAIFQSFDLFRFLAPSGNATLMLGMTGVVPVMVQGHWWTMITAIYLHGGLLHILFNMLWVRQLGPMVSELFGPFRLFIIFTVAGACGFALSVLMGNAYTLGASGSIFGLLAAAIVFGRQRGSSMFTRHFLQWAIILFIFGFLFSGVDNWAHAGGFAGGYVTAYAFSRDYSDREGIGTYLLAGALLALTILAFLFQFIAVISA